MKKIWLAVATGILGSVCQFAGVVASECKCNGSSGNRASIALIEEIGRSRSARRNVTGDEIRVDRANPR
jgi:hypothetical protein